MTASISIVKLEVETALAALSVYFKVSPVRNALLNIPKSSLIILPEDVPFAEFINVYLVFTRMPGESYRRRLKSLLSLEFM